MTDDDSERPSGARTWNDQARSLQQALIERWSRRPALNHGRCDTIVILRPDMPAVL